MTQLRRFPSPCGVLVLKFYANEMDEEEMQ